MTLKLKLRSGRWHIYGSLKGIEVRRSTGLPPEKQTEAEIRMAELTAELLRTGRDAPSLARPMVERRSSRRTWSAAADDYLARPHGVSPTTRWIVERLRLYWGGVALEHVTSSAIDVYANALTKKGLKPGTVHRHLTMLRAVMKRDHRVGRLRSVPHFEMPKVDDARDRSLTESGRDAFIAAASGPLAYMRPLVATLLYTGARLGEATELTPGDFAVLKVTNKDGKVVERPQVMLMTGKGGKRRKRSVPINHKAWSILEPIIRATKPGEPILRNHLGRPWGSGAGWGARVYKAWAKLCQITGEADFRPHDCRHTFATLLAQRGADLDVLAKLLGHANLEMVTRYKQVQPNRLAELVESL